MNKAISGNFQEIIYTKEINKKIKFWDKLDYDINNTFAIHINSKKYGQLNEAKIQPKADIYFAIGNLPSQYLIDNEYYLNEDDVEKFDLKFIPFSGISVKLPGSNYTITKISPNTFRKIFKSNILGAGASIFCSKEKEFYKNRSVLEGWNVEDKEFINYFQNKLSIEIVNIDLLSKHYLEKIKTHSNNGISELIKDSKKTSDLVFKGIGNFDEPYTAHWIIENDEFKHNYYIPFNITTGSGRSKGIFTIVLKPK